MPAASKKPSAALMDAIASTEVAPPQDRLERLREAARRWRDTAARIADLEERLAAENAALNRLQHEELPDLMDECHALNFTLAAEGNHPPVVLELKPYYSASIKPDSESAPAAFKWLRDAGHGDVIKNTITVALGMGDDGLAARVRAALKKLKVDFSAKVYVHPQSLTALVRELSEKQENPPLDLLGATVGRVVKPKMERKK